MTLRPTGPSTVLAVVRGGPDRAGRLCVLGEDGSARPVGELPDVAALVAAHPDAATLDAAVAAHGGVGAPVAWTELGAPARPAEVWAAGVTYRQSRDARMRESELQADIYQRVYDAERPELFLKATGPRVVGPDDAIGLRSDSAWQVPEPELGLVLGADGAILGFVLGNDVSSRDIEGDNPLYLPQAKIFAASCAIGPVVVAAHPDLDPYDLELGVEVRRDGVAVWQATSSTTRFHTRLERLVAYLRRDNWLAPGAVLLTGTGVVPDDAFTLWAGDVVEVACPQLGTLRNRCEPAGVLAPPAGWSAAAA